MSRLGVEVVLGGGVLYDIIVKCVVEEGLGELVEDLSFNERVEGWSG